MFEDKRQGLTFTIVKLSSSRSKVGTWTHAPIIATEKNPRSFLNSTTKGTGWKLKRKKKHVSLAKRNKKFDISSEGCKIYTWVYSSTRVSLLNFRICKKAQRLPSMPCFPVVQYYIEKVASSPYCASPIPCINKSHLVPLVGLKAPIHAWWWQ